ncbi:MAG: tetratricopeptide repeat protein [Bacteroidales bacterium]|nr:tetratricopeptide repeat protein [Bacteroidales bacterium]
MNIRLLLTGFATLCLMVSCTPSKEKMQAEIDGLEAIVLDQGDTSHRQELLACYDRFVQKHPEDSLAPEYLFRKAEVLRIGKEGDAALDVMAELVSRYPESPRVAECYFLRGLVYEEVFYDQDKAKKAYLSFIERYPEHPLAEDARYAIRYLGLSAEEIIASFEAKQPVEE